MATSNRDGRWTTEEHEAFLRGMAMYGRRWTKVADVVGTRTTVQVRSHAQKWEIKMAKEQKAKAANDVVVNDLGSLSSLQTSFPPQMLSGMNKTQPHTKCDNSLFTPVKCEDATTLDQSFMQATTPQDLLRLTSNLEEFKRSLSPTAMQSMNLLTSLPLNGSLPGGMDGIPNHLSLLRDSFALAEPVTTTKKNKRRGSNTSSPQPQATKSKDEKRNVLTQRRKKTAVKKEKGSMMETDPLPSDHEFERLAKNIVSNHQQCPDSPNEFSSNLWEMIWDEDGVDGSSQEWQHASESSEFTSSHNSTFTQYQPWFDSFPNNLDPMEPIDFQLTLAPSNECELVDIEAFGEGDFTFMSDDDC